LKFIALLFARKVKIFFSYLLIELLYNKLHVFFNI
jgi:hypothetical protein